MSDGWILAGARRGLLIALGMAAVACGPGLSSDADGVLTGYVAADLQSWESTQARSKQGFSVLLDGGTLAAVTDKDGLFRLDGAPLGIPHTLVISKRYHLSRTVSVPAGTRQIGAATAPICIWPGDFDANGIIDRADGTVWSEIFSSQAEGADVSDADLDGDGALNMRDQVLLSKHFEHAYLPYPACDAKESCPCAAP